MTDRGTLDKVYRRLCRSAYSLVGQKSNGIEISCKYCEATGMVLHGKSGTFVEHLADCPLVICEDAFAEEREREKENFHRMITEQKS